MDYKKLLRLYWVLWVSEEDVQTQHNLLHDGGNAEFYTIRIQLLPNVYFDDTHIEDLNELYDIDKWRMINETTLEITVKVDLSDGV